MRVRVQQEQKFLVTTERALWGYDNAFIFTNQSEVDFGITLVEPSPREAAIVSLILQALFYQVASHVVKTEEMRTVSTQETITQTLM